MSPSDEQILADLTDKNYVSPNGLADGFFEDITEAVEGGWNSLIGTAKQEGEKAITNKVKEAFGTNTPQQSGQQTPYDQMSQTALPQEQQQQQEKKESFVKKIHPAIVGAGTTAVVRFVANFGWVTSIASGVAAGAAKHYFIDKKQGA